MFKYSVNVKYPILLVGLWFVMDNIFVVDFVVL